ncbi:integrin beta [Striga asiatica]|uniref:Integrin beta n=1 Tax=Striga asiatica TaxID=4170 RepID=A0A5A7QMK8_STRAF|nr:integrin beta [Striga asiatica]
MWEREAKLYATLPVIMPQLFQNVAIPNRYYTLFCKLHPLMPKGRQLLVRVLTQFVQATSRSKHVPMYTGSPEAFQRQIKRKVCKGKLSSPESALTNLLGSAGPSPLALKPKTEMGPLKEHTGEVFPPMKNLSGKYEDILRDPLLHGTKMPADIPKFNAAP